MGKPKEQFGVFAVRCCGDDLAASGQYVDFEYRLVRQAVTERGGLDAQAGHRTAQGDGLELRHDQGRQPVGQRRVDEVLIRAHAGDVGCARRRIDGDDTCQTADVEAGGRRLGASAEQIGCLLCQAYRSIGGNGAV